MLNKNTFFFPVLPSLSINVVRKKPSVSIMSQSLISPPSAILFIEIRFLVFSNSTFNFLEIRIIQQIAVIQNSDSIGGSLQPVNLKRKSPRNRLHPSAGQINRFI